jgi:hypothetical protein
MAEPYAAQKKGARWLAGPNEVNRIHFLEVNGGDPRSPTAGAGNDFVFDPELTGYSRVGTGL